jgi:heme A synthase
MWGRAIGVMFVGPLLYFAVRRRIPASLYGRLGALLGLGAAQGGVGWWMVKSGLEHERFNEYSVPRVSPYRLATHVSGPVLTQRGSCTVRSPLQYFFWAFAVSDFDADRPRR